MILKLILNILGKNKNLIRRSNKIIYKKKIFIKYPFENELNKLPEKEKNFAVKKFMNNKYKNIKPQNMKELRACTIFLVRPGVSYIVALYLNEDRIAFLHRLSDILTDSGGVGDMKHDIFSLQIKKCFRQKNGF